MDEQPLAPLAGLALADALWAEGLAPSDAERHDRPGPLGLGDMHAYTYHRPATEFWRPWDSLDAVAHLLERYRISMCYSYGDWFIYYERSNVLEDEPSVPFADLPAAVACLALRLRATEEEEPPPCPAP